MERCVCAGRENEPDFLCFDEKLSLAISKPYIWNEFHMKNVERHRGKQTRPGENAGIPKIREIARFQKIPSAPRQVAQFRTDTGRMSALVSLTFALFGAKFKVIQSTESVPYTFIGIGKLY